MLHICTLPLIYTLMTLSSFIPLQLAAALFKTPETVLHGRWILLTRSAPMNFRQLFSTPPYALPRAISNEVAWNQPRERFRKD